MNLSANFRLPALICTYLIRRIEIDEKKKYIIKIMKSILEDLKNNDDDTIRKWSLG